MHTEQPAAHSADLWTPQQAAQALGVSARTLAAWRSTGRQDLPFVKVGRLVRYRALDVADWLQSRLSQTTIPHDAATPRKARPQNGADSVAAHPVEVGQ
ncbi:MAG TPA: helix-turn-helix domain-containing protein [Pseudomonas sp.]|nr:helix-turn-helix domain-containing protein [Pseudomonas sp.]